jgi:hypothetical protein
MTDLTAALREILRLRDALHRSAQDDKNEDGCDK